MSNKTPGVYVVEMPSFPPSVAQVETAIPAFVGYTATGTLNVPTRISSMLEYEALFGKGKAETFAVAVNTAQDTASVTFAAASNYKMYYALQMYFANGGGPCYILAVGHDSTTVTLAHYTGAGVGLELLEKEDEPTLLIFPDAEALAADAYTLYGKAIDQAELLGDRFVIMDVIGTVKAFREGVTASGLKYAAAYYPALNTALTYQYNEATTVVSGVVDPNDPDADIDTLAKLQGYNSALYNQAKNLIAAHRVVMQPSSAMAGAYAKTDSLVGVWKAPANIGLSMVTSPVIKISHKEQEDLNVDAVAGKSINAIRSFTGKGTLVWGARTFDGNSNEWRYVPVRRLFNMVEESVKKATEGFVFESNDAGTWIRIKSMIENFLNLQWKDGALAGSTPEQAYYVHVGLNQTMSAQDILEGRLIVEIGMAAVRPAEFIILRFSHKLQEA